MKIFNGLKLIKQLPLEQQEKFNKYCEWHKKTRLYPLYLDLILFHATLYALLSVYKNHNLPDKNASLLILAVLGIVIASLFGVFLYNRKLKFRLCHPLGVYMYSSIIIFMSLFFFVYYNGEIEKPFTAVYIGVLPAIGVLTFSLRHVFSVYMVFLISVMLAFFWVFEWGIALQKLYIFTVSYEFIFISMLPFLISIFNKWLHNSIIALRFLFQQENRELEKTIRKLSDTEDKLIQQQKRQEVSRMASGFLAEVVDPINISAKEIDEIKMTCKDGDVLEVLDDASKSQFRIEKIIENLIDFSSVSPKKELQKASFFTMLIEAMDACRDELKAHKIVFNKYDLEIKVHCYPDLLVQAMVNILKNAVMATNKKGLVNDGVIIVSLKREQDIVGMVFMDNGIGVSDINLKKIKEPFYTSNNESGNMGIGLNICENIMRFHKGYLDFSSEEGKGTSVEMNLPAKMEV